MRIVLIGDDGVGKSTLITCLFKDRYIPNIEDILPTLFFPTTTDSTVALVDTSPSLDFRHRLLAELRCANCIWLVYSDHYTMERISLFWLPFLRNSGVNLPIILCQNKQDRLFLDDKDVPELTSLEEEEEVIQLMQEFKEIESFVRCSAKQKRNVNEAFYLCQRAIVYPLAPLYDSKLGHLKPLAAKALSRIFFLVDEDQSGIMTRAKLDKLQNTVFGGHLEDEEVNLIHQTLANIQWENEAHNDKELNGDDHKHELERVNNMNGNAPSESSKKDFHEKQKKSLEDTSFTHISDKNLQLYTESLELNDEAADGITLPGFLRLAQLYCERGRHETIWAILRHYHYTDSLSLDDKFLKPNINVGPLSHVELSPDGYQFLVDLFALFDNDNDGGLSPCELQNLFTPTPGLPSLWNMIKFPYSTLRNDDGYVSLQGWLAQWSMFVHLEHTTALEYIAMLGYRSQAGDPDIKSAVRVTKPGKKRNPKSLVYRRSVLKDRQVINCFVFGSSGAGKSTLLSSFLGGKVRSSESVAPQTVVNSVEMPGGKQCYLILQEFGNFEDAILDTPHKLDECDVVCLTYDSSDPDSFAHLVKLRSKHKELDALPIVFAALKADQDRAQQRCDEQPDEYTTALGLAAPMHVSSNWPSSLNALFVQLVDSAIHPGQATITYPGEELEESLLPELLVGTIIASAVAVTWWFTYYRRRAM